MGHRYFSSMPLHTHADPFRAGQGLQGLCVTLVPNTVPGKGQALETHVLIKCRGFLESRA